MTLVMWVLWLLVVSPRVGQPSRAMQNPHSFEPCVRSVLLRLHQLEPLQTCMSLQNHQKRVDFVCNFEWRASSCASAGQDWLRGW